MANENEQLNQLLELDDKKMEEIFKDFSILEIEDLINESLDKEASYE